MAIYSSKLTWPKQGASASESGTLSYLDAGGEQTVVELTPSARIFIHGIFCDLNTITQDGDIKLYFKIDGSNYREFHNHAFTVATDSDGVWLDVNAIVDDDFKVTYTEDADEGAARDIPYKLFYSEME